MTPEELAKREFAAQLRLYRERTTLSQGEFGAFFRLSKSTINTYESGKYAIGVDKMEMFARAFGIRHFHMANPTFPIPEWTSIPLKFRRYIDKVIKERERIAAEKQHKKAVGEPIYRKGRSKQLQGIFEAGFFSKSRTAKEAFFKLNPDVSKNQLTEIHQKEIASITSTLSSGRFAKLLDKLEPLPGSIEVRFVEKAVNA